jgi:Tfp pilus assembly protein PilO
MRKFDTGELWAKVLSYKDDAKVLLTAAGVIVLLDLFVLVCFQAVPLARSWSKARQIKTDILQGRQDSHSIEAFKTRLGNLKTELSDLDKKTLTQEEFPQVLEAISKFADISTVRIIKIRPMSEVRGVQKTTEVSKDEKLVREKISITAIAGFHQLGRFIALLENAPTFFDIRRLEIRADNQEHMKHSVTIFLDVVTRKS